MTYHFCILETVVADTAADSYGAPADEGYGAPADESYGAPAGDETYDDEYDADYYSAGKNNRIWSTFL